jgi:hypothetical protein
MSRADDLAAEAAMAEEAQHATPSKDALKAMTYLPSFVRRVSAHQFQLSELPPDLRDALADYDVDGDGAQPCVWQRIPAPRPARPAKQRACCLSTLAVAQRRARRHSHGGRDRGGRSPPAPAEEKGTHVLSACPPARAFSADAS